MDINKKIQDQNRQKKIKFLMQYSHKITLFETTMDSLHMLKLIGCLAAFIMKIIIIKRIVYSCKTSKSIMKLNRY